MNLVPFNWTEAVSGLIKDNLKTALSGMVGMGRQVAKDLSIKYERAFKALLEDQVARYSNAKTVLYRDQSMPFYSFYEPLDVKAGLVTFEAAGIADLCNRTPRWLITGLAGVGKSTLLRHFLLDCIKTKYKIPILIELRKLNESGLSVLDHIFHHINSSHGDMQREEFETALKWGKFAFLLDGFDEVNPERREQVRSELLGLPYEYEGNVWIVSTRPEAELRAWSTFTVGKAQELKQTQAISLIEKLHYDETIKTRFMRELGKTLFKRHKSFLSNPLLLTITLMTYADNAFIPEKQHLFYDQVFHTLYNKHDAYKEGYSRRFHTLLSKDDFERVVQHFAIISFLEGRLTFDEPKLVEILSEAMRLAMVDGNPQKFLNDLVESVCIVTRDGTEFSFTHRSFQEYFAASFLKNTDADTRKMLFEKIPFSPHSNQTYMLLFGMSAHIVEDELLPLYLDPVREEGRIGSAPAQESVWRLTCLIFEGIGTKIVSQTVYRAKIGSTRRKVEQPVPVFRQNGESVKHLLTFLRDAYPHLAAKKTSTKSQITKAQITRLARLKEELGVIPPFDISQVIHAPQFSRQIAQLELVTPDDVEILNAASLAISENRSRRVHLGRSLLNIHPRFTK